MAFASVVDLAVAPVLRVLGVQWAVFVDGRLLPRALADLAPDRARFWAGACL